MDKIEFSVFNTIWEIIDGKKKLTRGTIYYVWCGNYLEHRTVIITLGIFRMEFSKINLPVFCLYNFCYYYTDMSVNASIMQQNNL